MSKPLIDRIPFAKITTILAVAFGIGFGLCGIGAIVSDAWNGNETLNEILGYCVGAILGLSALGLLLTFIVYIILKIVAAFTRK